MKKYADTLEGRRQADAIEDWLCNNYEKLWEQASDDDLILDHDITHHQWRLDRIKWCVEELDND